MLFNSCCNTMLPETSGIILVIFSCFGDIRINGRLLLPPETLVPSCPLGRWWISRISCSDTSSPPRLLTLMHPNVSFLIHKVRSFFKYLYVKICLFASEYLSVRLTIRMLQLDLNFVKFSFRLKCDDDKWRFTWSPTWIFALKWVCGGSPADYNRFRKSSVSLLNPAHIKLLAFRRRRRTNHEERVGIVSRHIQDEQKISLCFQSDTEHKCGVLRTLQLHQSIVTLSEFCFGWIYVEILLKNYRFQNFIFVFHQSKWSN